jgi:hypothetical protein
VDAHAGQWVFPYFAVGHRLRVLLPGRVAGARNMPFVGALHMGRGTYVLVACSKTSFTMIGSSSFFLLQKPIQLLQQAFDFLKFNSVDW